MNTQKIIEIILHNIIHKPLAISDEIFIFFYINMRATNSKCQLFQQYYIFVGSEPI